MRWQRVSRKPLLVFFWDFYSQMVFQAAMSGRDNGIQRVFQSVVEGVSQWNSFTQMWTLLQRELFIRGLATFSLARVLEKTLAVLKGPEFWLLIFYLTRLSCLETCILTYLFLCSQQLQEGLRAKLFICVCLLYMNDWANRIRQCQSKNSASASRAKYSKCYLSCASFIKYSGANLHFVKHV